ncbi:hypothetical protein BGZ65_002486, partial [Modicella reniformis]
MHSLVQFDRFVVQLCFLLHFAKIRRTTLVVNDVLKASPLKDEIIQKYAHGTPLLLQVMDVLIDFDEELYTTKLDRTGADFKLREQQAIQIANEIQQSVSNSSNVHIREERGLGMDDSGLDEEDRYGAV